MNERVRWYPPLAAQAFNWYMTQALRIVGGFGFVWELIWDKGRNPLVMLLSVQLGTSTDVLGVVRGLIQQAKQERRSLEQLVNEEEARERPKDTA